MFISDEIYHGISYEGREAQTALAYSDQCYVINSFSKYYSMTGAIHHGCQSSCFFQPSKLPSYRHNSAFP